MLLDLQECREIARVQALEKAKSIAYMRLDPLHPTRAAIATDSGELSVWDISGARPELLSRFHIEQSRPTGDLALHKDWLFHTQDAASDDLQPLTVWHWPSRVVVHSAHFGARDNVQFLFPFGPASFFAEQQQGVALFEISANNELACKAQCDLGHDQFRCRQDTRRARGDGVLIFGTSAVHAWRADDAAPPIAWPAQGQYSFTSIHPRLPRHLVRQPNDCLALIERRSSAAAATPGATSAHVRINCRVRKRDNVFLDFRFLVRPMAKSSVIRVYDFGGPQPRAC